jgi:hypothetical protein
MRTNGINARRTHTHLVIAALLLAVVTAAPAVVPLIAGMGKQILQNMIFGEVKGQLIGSLAQMGCKGAALAGLVANADLKRGAPGMPRAGVPPDLADRVVPPVASPAGNATGIQGGGVAGMLSGLRDKLQSLVGGQAAAYAAPAELRSESAARSMAEVERLTGRPAHQVGRNLVVGEGAPNLADAYAMAQMEIAAGARQSMFGGPIHAQLQDKAPIDEQVAPILAQMQAAMSTPLSRAETLAVFDQMAELGVLTPAMRSEARDCIRLAPPSADAALGQTGAMFKSMVLPQMQMIKQQLADLPAEDQQVLAEELTQALREADVHDRKAFSEGFGTGFFPAGVVQRVRASGVLQ